jgi:hypothetical protein
MLLAKHRGCTAPGCTASGYRSQAHHANQDWKDGGHTNIEDLTLACGPDNRMVEETGWTTRNRADGITNGYHHRNWTAAKPASTPTTTPTGSSPPTILSPG